MSDGSEALAGRAADVPVVPDETDAPEQGGAASAAAAASGMSGRKPRGSGASRSRVPHRLSTADFMFGPTLGEGAYARVVHAQMKASGERYALKVMEKRFIKKEDKVRFVMQEKQILSSVSHPNVVKLFYTFKDEDHLYMAMELCPRGTLLHLIRHFAGMHEEAGAEPERAMPPGLARAYMAELVHALEYLHDRGIVHRDVKPENILLDAAGHVKLADFGTAVDTRSGGRRNTFCGTAEYVAPEVLRDEGATESVDLWALGCVLFQMLVGRPPFRAESEYLLFQLILDHPANMALQLPDHVSDAAQDLIRQLLHPDPAQRLGIGPAGTDRDYAALKRHDFFEGIDFTALHMITPIGLPAMPPLPPCPVDGAQQHWMLAGIATELDEAMFDDAQAAIEPDPVLASMSVGAAATPVAAGAAGPPSGNQKWNQFLMPAERIVYMSPVWKRVGLFSKKRQLILTDTPRLLYVDTAKMVLKGEVPWSEGMYVELRSTTAFDVVTPKRTYHLTVIEGAAQAWLESIHNLLGKYM